MKQIIKKIVIQKDYTTIYYDNNTIEIIETEIVEDARMKPMTTK